MLEKPEVQAVPDLTLPVQPWFFIQDFLISVFSNRDSNVQFDFLISSLICQVST